MYCPKCGTQNPESGKFCRSCGTDLANVSHALSGKITALSCTDHKGRPVTIDRAIMKIFGGLAFVAVAIALAVTGMGRGWWFWMLIPAITSLGAGVAQFVQLRSVRQRNMVASAPATQTPELTGRPTNALPQPQTEFVTPESRYRTGDLVPPSVTDGTTRHLELDRDGETMTLPKRS